MNKVNYLGILLILKQKQWGECKPEGYVPDLLGSQWVWGVTDCWSLVVDWYKQEKGIRTKRL